MQDFRDKLKDIKEQVREAERNRPNYDFYDPVEYVVDLKTRDCVLFIGENTVFPDIKRTHKYATSVRKSRELESLEAAGNLYDRIFISKNSVLTEALVMRAVNLTSAQGIVCFFTESEELQAAFIEIVENNWPTADVWICHSNVGPVCMTNARGNTKWQS